MARYGHLAPVLLRLFTAFVNPLFFVMRGAPEMSVDALIQRGRKGR
jgi:hypothetical protein